MNFKFIGWMNDGTHDKIWGVLFLEPLSSPSMKKYYKQIPTMLECATFWGRRGGKLQIKILEDDGKLYKLIESKKNKGYQEVDEKKLHSVYPEFKQDLESMAIMAMLKK